MEAAAALPPGPARLHPHAAADEPTAITSLVLADVAKPSKLLFDELGPASKDGGELPV